MVEGTGLENQRAGNRTVGSNPTLSAIANRFRLSERATGECVAIAECDDVFPNWPWAFAIPTALAPFYATSGSDQPVRCVRFPPARGNGHLGKPVGQSHWLRAALVARRARHSLGLFGPYHLTGTPINPWTL